MEPLNRRRKHAQEDVGKSMLSESIIFKDDAVQSS